MIPLMASTRTLLRPAIPALAAAACAAVLVAGCTSPAPPDASPDPEPPEPVALPQVEADPPEDVPSALQDMRHEDFPEPLVDPSEIISGGPPPDGIPPIDEPTFLKAGDVDFLDDNEAILEFTIGGETRGYPVQIMTWHEIVNDTVGGVPVTVTYCPLCNSGLAFEREVDGRVLSFGTSGRLWANNLVMYDRQTETLWPQMSFTASVGVLTGTELTPHLATLLAWSEFRQAHPDAWVLSRDTGHDRDYGRNPYIAYDQPDREPLFDPPTDDARLPAQTRVIGIEDDDGDGTPVAVVRDQLADAAVMELTIGDTDLIAWHRPGQASALDDARISGGRDIGTAGVFLPEADGQHLTFTPTDDGFRDEQTGTTWTVLGRATDGPLAGEQLTPYRHVDTFWHAWVAFQPDTTVVP
jgi:hypothetical protein